MKSTYGMESLAQIPKPGIRNPYRQKLEEASGRVFISDKDETVPKDWLLHQSVFLEIGSNAGHWLINQALSRPLDYFIGMDLKFKQVFRAFEKSEKQNAENTFWLRADANHLATLFPKNSLDGIYVFFPDPWPKRRHLKNRLLTAAWLQSAWSTLKPGGFIHIKTDHASYFESVMQEFNLVKEIWNTPRISHYGKETAAELTELGKISVFEKAFLAEGRTVHELQAMKES